MIKTLLCCGISDVAGFIALRPNFDICYGIDSNPSKIEYLQTLFKFDNNVHLFTAAGPLNPYEFCIEKDIRQIDTMVISMSGGGLEALKTMEPFSREKRVGSIQCEIESRLMKNGIDASHNNTLDELTKILGGNYDFINPLYEVSSDNLETMDIRCKVKRIPEASIDAPSMGMQTEKKRYTFNVIYIHLQPSEAHTIKRGNVAIIASSSPIEGCDLYLYNNAYSYGKKQKGYNVLLLSEPIVVLPGQYNEHIWQHFDHIFTLYDTFMARDNRFTKIPMFRSGWASIDDTVTENMEEREKLYPLKDRKNAICMINGNKSSYMTGELYSKRVEAALWFFYNSRIPLDVYGEPPFFLPNYKGSLPKGVRLATTAQYRYNLCFENMNHPEFALGYVEKMLDCLETRTIPIYLGSPNVEQYIPKDCFIDFRDFDGFDSLNNYLSTMTDKRYMDYIKNIDQWAARGGLRPYSWYTLYDYLIQYYASCTGINISSLTGEDTFWEKGPAEPINVSMQTPALWTFLDLASTVSQFTPLQDVLDASKADLFENVQRATGLATEGKYDEALKEMARTKYNGDAGLHFFCAQLMHIAGFEEPELVQLDIALKLNPNHSLAHNQLGTVHFKNKLHNKAEIEFRKAIELDNNNLLAHKNLAFLLMQTGKKKEAVSIINKIADTFPEAKTWLG
jgi:alpha(1,3/1,4) fucosyltransferase